MIYSHTINGLPIKAGDLICTVDGGASFLAGQCRWLVGKILPGDLDHIIIYLGPEGQCVEAGRPGP